MAHKLNTVQAKIDGKGTCKGPAALTVPGVPPSEPFDCRHDPAADYDLMQSVNDSIACVWIRRAVHAEAFASALERELEALRQKQK